MHDPDETLRPEHRLENAKQVNLPVREFFYTLDQVAQLLGVSMAALRRYVYREGLDAGVRQPSEMPAHNIAAPGDPADWRITERNFVTWLRKRGIRIYTRRS